MGSVRAYCKKKPWHDDEIALLIKLYPTSRRSTIRECFPDRTPSSIETKAHLMGMSRKKIVARSLDDTRAAKRKQMAARREIDPQRERDNQRRWRELNPGRVASTLKRYAEKRFFWIRSARLKGSVKASPRELSSLWRTQRGICAMTGQRLDRTAELDHIIPKSRGGSNEIGNLQWVTRIVNRAKTNLTSDEFRVLCMVIIGNSAAIDRNTALA